MEEKTGESNSNTPRKTRNKNEYKLLFMLLFTSFFFLVEVVIGYWTKSMSLIADSFNMLSDVVALTIGLVILKLSGKDLVKKSTFDLSRLEVLGALTNMVFLYALCFMIFVESVKRCLQPESIENPFIVFVVGVAGLVVNVIGLILLHEPGRDSHNTNTPPKITSLNELQADKDSPSDTSKEKDVKIEIKPETIVQPVLSDGSTKYKNTTTKEEQVVDATRNDSGLIHAVFLQIYADALGSVVVIISASIVWLTDWKFEDYIDPALSIILVFIIACSGWPLFKESCRQILLQSVTHELSEETLKARIANEVESVLAVHDLRILQITGSEVIATVHVVYSGEQGQMELLDKITSILSKEGVHSSTVQLEHVKEEDKNPVKLYNCISKTNTPSQQYVPQAQNSDV